MIASLLNHLWLRRVRSSRAGSQLAASLLVLFVVAYVGLGLVGIAYTFPRVAETLAPDTPYAVVLDRALLAVALAYGLLRFFLQRSPETEARAYRTLPVSHRTLLGVLHLDALLSWLNVLPFAFAVPYLQYHLPTSHPAGGFLWMAGVALLVLGTHVLGLGLRLLVNRGVGALVGTVAAVALAVVADTGTGLNGLPRASEAVFGALRAGSTAALGALALGVGAMGAVVHEYLRRDLRHLPGAAPTADPFSESDRWEHFRQQARDWVEAQMAGRGALGRHLLMEWRLVTRCKRPRQMQGVGVVLGIVYVPLLLVPELVPEGADVSPVTLALACFIGMAMGTLNHGQFVFAWHGAHIDALWARIRDLETWVQAQVAFLQSLAIPAIVVLVPLLGVWNPRLLTTFGAVVLYNLGAVCPFMVGLATWNREPIRLGASTWFNYEGVRAWHFFAGVIVLGPLLGIYALLAPPWNDAVAGGIGLIGFAATPLWRAAITRRLRRVRHAMAAGFHEA